MTPESRIIFEENNNKIINNWDGAEGTVKEIVIPSKYSGPDYHKYNVYIKRNDKYNPPVPEGLPASWQPSEYIYERDMELIPRAGKRRSKSSNKPKKSAKRSKTAKRSKSRKVRRQRK
jgi:RIO-like serine/threonine protein kinase